MDVSDELSKLNKTLRDLDQKRTHSDRQIRELNRHLEKYQPRGGKGVYGRDKEQPADSSQYRPKREESHAAPEQIKTEARQDESSDEDDENKPKDRRREAQPVQRDSEAKSGQQSRYGDRERSDRGEQRMSSSFKRYHDDERTISNYRRRTEHGRADSRGDLMSTVIRPTKEGKTEKTQTVEEKKASELVVSEELKMRSRRLFSALNKTLIGFQTDLSSQKQKELSQKRKELEDTIETQRKQQMEIDKQAHILKLREERFKLRQTSLEKKILDQERKITFLKKSKLEQLRCLSGFIQTEANAPIFWIPSNPTKETTDLVEKTKEKLQKQCMEEIKKLEESIHEIIEKYSARLKQLQERKEDPNKEGNLSEHEDESQDDEESQHDHHSEENKEEEPNKEEAVKEEKEPEEPSEPAIKNEGDA